MNIFYTITDQQTKFNETFYFRFVLLCRPTRLDLYSASPNETTMYGKTCTSTRTHYPDSEPTSLCSYSLMQRAQRRSNNYQLYSLWFETTRGERVNHYTTDAVHLPLNNNLLLIIRRKHYFVRKLMSTPIGFYKYINKRPVYFWA